MRSLGKAMILGALLLGGSAPPVPAQQGMPSVSLEDTLRVASPGSAIAYVFGITSDGAPGSTELKLPEGWRTLSGGGDLAAGSRRIIYMVSASVPASARPGRYRVELIVRQGGRTASAHAWVTVRTTHLVALSAVDAPDLVVAGTTIRTQVSASNRGNARARIRIGISSGLLSVTDSTFLDLEPGASQVIPVVLRTNESTRSIVEAVTTITAEVMGGGAPVARSVFRTKVAPAEAYAPAPVHVLSSRVRFFGSSTPEGGSGIEAAGSGLLREGSNARVEYLARRMSQRSSLFGERDEYRISLTSPTASVIIGDQVNRLSPLSENGRFARGARVEASSDGWTVGGFVNRSLNLRSRAEERALFFKRDFGNGLFMDANYLDRKEPRGGKMLTGHALFKSVMFGVLEGEVGHAINGPHARAWMLRAAGSFQRFAYSLYRQKADRNYPGSTRGMDQLNATLSAEPLPGIRLHAAARDSRFPHLRHALDSSTSRHWNQTAGVSLRQISFDYIRSGRHDASFTAQPKREERLVAARVALDARRASVNASAAFGVSAADASESRKLARYSAGVTARPHKGVSFSVNGELLQGGTLFFPGQASERRAGAGVTVEPRAGSRFSANAYAAEHMYGAAGIRDAGLDASLEQDLPRGHRLSLRLRVHRNPLQSAMDDNVLRAEYVIPYGLPVAQSRTSGRVSGRIYSVESGTAVRGAIVQLGNQVAMTDARGRYAFKTVSEADQMLTITGSPATAGTLPVRDLPLRVQPVMGRTQTFDIALAKAGSVAGKLRRFVTPPGFRGGEPMPPVEDPDGLAGAQLELVRDGEVRRAVSTAGGQFLFPDLKPGSWHLRIPVSQVPEFHYVQGDSVVVVVYPGERTLAEAVILPRKRKITIVQGR